MGGMEDAWPCSPYILHTTGHAMSFIFNIDII